MTLNDLIITLTFALCLGCLLLWVWAVVVARMKCCDDFLKTKK